MIEYKSDQEIYDRFAEAATALIMRQYATAERKTAVKTAPEAKTSEELDAKCHKLIKKRLRNQQIKIISKMALRYTKRVAMFVVMLFGIVGILFTAVEAVRVPIINFFIEQKDGYFEIYSMEAGQESSETEGISNETPLDGLLPEEYILSTYQEKEAGGVLLIYENSDGKTVLFSENSYSGTLNIDNEEAVTERLTILSYEAVLIGKEEYQLVWLDPNNKRIYRLESDALSREQLIALAEKIENNR